MAFINEYISPEDREIYQIDAINQRFIVGGTHSRTWTVDKERNMYLRHVARGREEFASRTDWTFYWQGQLVVFRMEMVSTARGPNDERFSHEKITRLDIPSAIAHQRDAILQGIEEALVAYKDGGVFASGNEHTLTLEIAPGV